MHTASGDGSGSVDARGYLHGALLYDSPDVLSAVAVPFVQDGLTAGNAVVIAAAPRTVDLLREAAGDDPLLRVLDRAEVYGRRTPGAISVFRRLADDLGADGSHRVRVVGEVDFGRTERDRLEWQRYEAVLNSALADRPLEGLCVFDARTLPDPVLDSAVRTHPTLLTGEGPRSNPGFVDPAEYLRDLPLPEEPLQQTLPRLEVRDVTDFIGLRHAVAAELATARGPRDTVEDFLLAVDEMISNAVRHGAPPVDLRLWTSADRVVCTVSDRGPGLDDPFAGYGPAHGNDLSRGGMGLWLARQLCDHVDVWGGNPGVTVRLTTRLH